jgi:hypothetical protein
VVLKYDGMFGFADPRRSRRRKRLIELRAVRYVDNTGWYVCSHVSAKDLDMFSCIPSKYMV